MSRRDREFSKYSFLHNLTFMLDYKFDPIKAYLESTQGMIIHQQGEINEKYNKWNEEHKHNPEIPEAFEIYETEIIHNSEFSRILNQSIYLTIYSTFENELFDICETCQQIEQLNIGPKDINEQSYIGQCRKYIMKVLNVNLDNSDQKWNEIKNYQKIRNSIAHNLGIIKSPDANIINFVERSNGISFNIEKSKISIDSIDFLKTLIDKFIYFLINIGEEIIKQKDKNP